MKIKLLLIIFSITLLSCSKDEPDLSSENIISVFNIKIDNVTYNGTINQTKNEITFNTKGLENHTAIIPSVTFSANATISPDPSVAQNFNNDINYIVTAENGTQKNYKILINNAALLSSQKKILQFDFNIDGEAYSGVIDHSTLTISIETNRSVTNIQPIISVSENSTFTPDSNNTQNFNNSIEYTVTAEDGTENTYTVSANVYIINGTYNFSNQLYYKNAITVVSGFGLNVTIPNSSIVLENDHNSYTLTTTNYNTSTYSQGEIFTSFNIVFPDNIITATDYKLKYKINGITKVISRFSYDVMAENIPIINSSNQDVYKRGDILIFYGTNLAPGMYIYAYNGSIYSYGSNDINVNTNKTELTHILNRNEMFPSYYGVNDNHPTKIQIIANGRFGITYTVDFD